MTYDAVVFTISLATQEGTLDIFDEINILVYSQNSVSEDSLHGFYRHCSVACHHQSCLVTELQGDPGIVIIKEAGLISRRNQSVHMCDRV